MKSSALYSDASHTIPLWDSEPFDGAFTIDLPTDNIEQAVVKSVTRPWVIGFTPTPPISNGRAVLILGGGGYVELMVGREGIQVAKWLTSLGFHAFVLVHRFPNAEMGAQAPLDDARQALRLVQRTGVCGKGLGICGLSSGGHLGAALLSRYPDIWSEKENGDIPKIEFAIIGYAPISTNAKGRQIMDNKPDLPPKEKQELYDTVQPDVQLRDVVPPTFIVYSGNDPVVPVVNAYRLAEGMRSKGGSTELHIFADAPHGFALDTVGLPVSKWVKMCESWLGQLGLLI